jgi:molybdenum cofactor cytidylyltransferase
MFTGISAILLAAGESRRMGQPKLLLPWGGTTVLGRAVAAFAAAGIPEIVVVTGGARAEVEALVAELAGEAPVRAAFNPDYASGGMLSSIQCGLRSLGSQRGAALIGLGDQPQVREETVRSICAAFLQRGRPLVIPSFDGRRGHPWLAARPLWEEVLALPLAATARQFIAAHAGQVEYVEADATVLQDLDTPEDYAGREP